MPNPKKHLRMAARALCLWVALASEIPAQNHSQEVDWSYYGGQAGGMRFSPLTQINKSNVQRLKVAWEFRTGDISRGENRRQKSSFESTPIMVDGLRDHLLQSHDCARSGDGKRKMDVRPAP
jgi:glucose dehydrogenase